MSKAIDAAFCSSKANECYIFVKERYVVVDFAPGGKKNAVISGPSNIVDGFPMFANTLFQRRIDCSLDTEDNATFIFSGKQCAKLLIDPYSVSSRLLIGPIPINAMFPPLKGTIFENGIDAIMRSTEGNHVHLFKGDLHGSLSVNFNTLSRVTKIGSQFPPLRGTVFERGIDAAFNTQDYGECFIFKGKYCAQYNLIRRRFLNGYVKLISDEWPALDNILL